MQRQAEFNRTEVYRLNLAGCDPENRGRYAPIPSGSPLFRQSRTNARGDFDDCTFFIENYLLSADATGNFSYL